MSTAASKMVATLLAIAALGIVAVSCRSEVPRDTNYVERVDSASSAAAGMAAVERFMTTWNTRDPVVWASSLHFPHARPSAGSDRVWQTAEEYIADVDYAPLIASGWDHTKFEELRLIHDGDTKAHVAGRWARFDAAGNVIRRNLVSYIVTRTGGTGDGVDSHVDGEWGIQARFGAGAPLPEGEAEPIAQIAIAKVEEYMAAFNARDPVSWAATLNYPHLRIAGGDFRIWETEEEVAAGMDFDAFAERFGWDHSGWDQIEAVQVAETGANVALTFSRYNADDEVISTFNTLYLVTHEMGRWGIRARSSFAP